MSSRFPLLTPRDLSEDQQYLYDQITAPPRADGPFTIKHDDGSLAGPFNALLFTPGIGNALQELGAALRFKGKLPDRMRELVICAVASALGAEYEWYAHSRVAAVVGVSDSELTQLKGGALPREASEEETAALELTRELIAEAGVTGSTFERAREQLGLAGLTEVSILVGYYRTLAGVLAVAAAELPNTEPQDNR